MSGNVGERVEPALQTNTQPLSAHKICSVREGTESARESDFRDSVHMHDWLTHLSANKAETLPQSRRQQLNWPAATALPFLNVRGTAASVEIRTLSKVADCSVFTGPVQS